MNDYRDTSVGGEPPARLEDFVSRATAGDRGALEFVIRAVQTDVYNLAVRMLWHPEDAADAAQDILLKVVTHLATFRSQSAFRTWVYRIAVNHLLNVRKSLVEREELTFSTFGEQLAVGLSEQAAARASEPDQALLEEEVKIGCTQGLLLCLDRDHRVAYILGDVFDLQSDQAAAILDVTPSTFRKRLSRARERMRTFMRTHCGLVNPGAACRCQRRIASAVASGRVQPRQLLFAGKGAARRADVDVAGAVRHMEDLHRIAAIYKSHPEYSAPERLVAVVQRALDGPDFTLPGNRRVHRRPVLGVRRS